MSIPKQPKPAKLVIGVFLNQKDLLEKVFESLTKKFGEVDIISKWFVFDYTAYYEKEMGSPLFRRVMAFKKLINQDDLADIKCETNIIEKNLSKDEKRQVNIDPGYLLLERFVLATGKNYTHRIYIGKGIYADLTLIFTKGAFQKLEWTYPDYAEPLMLSFLEQIRNKYKFDLKEHQ